MLWYLFYVTGVPASLFCCRGSRSRSPPSPTVPLPALVVEDPNKKLMDATIYRQDYPLALVKQAVQEGADLNHKGKLLF